MRTLFSYALCPFSRKVRLVLEEKKLYYQLESEPIWKRREEFLDLNHTGEVPVFIDVANGKPHTFTQSQAIVEFINDTYQDTNLLPGDALNRALIRQKCLYYDINFHKDITHKIVFEKALKRKMGQGSLDSKTLRAGQTNLPSYLEHASWTLENNDWICGENLTLADFTLAAHLSCLDYFGTIDWNRFPVVKDWYARLKSRPCFRSLLKDKIPGITPATHYSDLDF